MSKWGRRKFLASTAGAAGMSLVGSTSTAAAAAKGSSNGLSQDGLVFDLGGIAPMTFPGGTLREHDVNSFPASPTIAGALIEFVPGGVRGYHWHKEAGEYGAVLEGSIVLTVVDEQQRVEVGEVGTGDVYYVPRGFGHALACAGDKPAKVVIGYDDGRDVETNALELADWVPSVPAAILQPIVRDVPTAELHAAASNTPLITKGPPLNAGSLKPRGQCEAVPESFRYKMSALPENQYHGGSFVQASINEFPNSRTMVGAFTRLKPGGVREPHWHPNADEWDFVISGQATVTLFDGAGKTGQVVLGPGQVGFLPRNQAHGLVNEGGEDFYLFSIFNADNFEAIGLAGTLGALPAEIAGPDLGLKPEQAAKLPLKSVFIVPTEKG